MCDIMEAAIQEAREEARKEVFEEHKRLIIGRLLDKNKMSYAEIAEIVSGTVAEVEEAAKLKAEQTCVFERP